MKKRKQDTITDILNIKFAGNYKDDAKRFERVSRFLARKDVHPYIKFAADLHANVNGMGIPGEAVKYPGDDYYNDYQTGEEL